MRIERCTMPWSRTVPRVESLPIVDWRSTIPTATVPDAALALALCGETGPALKEMERLAADGPTNASGQ